MATHTSIAQPPSLPELRLHMASDADRLWRMTAEERAQNAADLPYWAFPWVGGQALARWLLDNPAEVAGRDVLDMGSGSGLVAIAACLAGAGTVTAADIDPLAQAAMQLNARLNAVRLKVEARDLLATPLAEAFDLILVGDLFYDAALASRLLPWLRTAAAGGARVLIGDCGRTYLPRAELIRISTLDIEIAAEIEDEPVKAAGVFMLSVSEKKSKDA